MHHHLSLSLLLLFGGCNAMHSLLLLRSKKRIRNVWGPPSNCAPYLSPPPLSAVHVRLLVFPVKFFFNSIPAMNLPHKRHVESLAWGSWSPGRSLHNLVQVLQEKLTTNKRPRRNGGMAAPYLSHMLHEVVKPFRDGPLEQREREADDC